MPRNPKKPKSPSSPAPALDPALIETAPAAFASVRAEIEAIQPEALLHINVDIPRAARCGLVTAENVEPLLPTLAELGHFDVRPVRMLCCYSLALLHAHDLATEGGVDLPPLPVLVAEATPLREGMLRNAELLAHYGLVSAERVAAIRSGHGHADLAGDVQTLGRLFDELWPRVQGKVLVTREEVDRAIVLGPQLQRALALHETEKNPLTKHQGRRHVRAQAYTLFYRAYEETRRGVTFLRWYEGDAQGIVPSFRPRTVRRLGRTPSGEALDDLRDPSGVIDDGDPTPTPNDLVNEA